MLRLMIGACAAVLVGAGIAHAQPAQGLVQGRVTDGESGLPLPGATVAVPTLDIGAATDADGRYRLAIPSAGGVRIVFSFVGYRAETRGVALGNRPVTLDVVLAPSFVEAPDVTVTARARASDVLSTPQSVAVVDGAALARSAGGTPLDALDGVAGVRLLRTGPGIAKPVIRGLTAQRVLIVQDGVRQESQSWGDEHGPELGSAEVDGIEVVRGPSSLLYGSDALGGVVQTTRDNLFDRAAPLTGEVTLAGLGATQQGEAALEVGGLSGRWGYEGRLGLLRGGQVETPDGLVPNTAQERGTGSLRLGYRVGERGALVVEASRFDARNGIFEPEEDDAGEEPVEPFGRYTIGEPYLRTQHDRAALRADLPLGRHRLDAVAALQQNRLREFGHEHGVEEEEHEEDEGEPALYLRLTTGTTDLRLHHRPLGPVFGTLGVSGLIQTNETLAEETLIPGAMTLNGAAYVAEQLVLPTLTLDAGLRLDARRLDVDATPDLGVAEESRTYTALTGAVGVAWQPRSAWSLAANLGRAWRAPTLQELFGNGVHDGTLRFERGDAGLEPEAALSLDGVVRYLTPHVYAEVSAFVNALDGYIFPRPTAEVDSASGLQVYDYAQADARLVGAEFRLDVHPHGLHGLGIHLAGDLTQGTNLEADAPLPFVPPARLRAAVQYRADAFGPAREVEARLGPTLTAAQRRPELAEEPTDAYAVWDLSASVAFPFSNGLALRPALAIDNLFDAAYVDPLSRFRPYGVLAPGRSIRLSLRIELGS